MTALSITLDAEGGEELLTQLGFLRDAPDHLHLWSEAWVGADGADLTQLALSGEGFHCCQELSIGLVADDFFADGREASAYAEMSGSEGEELSLQVALAFTASGLLAFGNTLRELSEAGGSQCCQYPVERLRDGCTLPDTTLDCHIRYLLHTI